MSNSEFGNEWGYEGRTGDVDWSWDYHRAVDAFRRHPRICGWLYTEHHDVINEWNGYWRYDRSWKETGFGDLVAGTSLRAPPTPPYIAGRQPQRCRPRPPGEPPHAAPDPSVPTGSTNVGDILVLASRAHR